MIVPFASILKLVSSLRVKDVILLSPLSKTLTIPTVVPTASFSFTLPTKLLSLAFTSGKSFIFIVMFCSVVCLESYTLTLKWYIVLLLS